MRAAYGMLMAALAVAQACGGADAPGLAGAIAKLGAAPEPVQGQSISLTGASDWVQLSSAVLPAGPSGAFSVEMWVKHWHNVNGSFRLLGRDTNLYGLKIGVDDKGIAIEIRDSGGRIRRRDGTSRYNTWFHLVVTYNGSGSAGGTAIYINGSSVGGIVNNTSVTANYPAPPSVGASSVGQNASCVIDELVIYDYALTAGEAAASYNSGAGTYHTPAAGKVAIYHFDGDATDASGNGYDGAVQNHTAGYASGVVYTP